MFRKKFLSGYPNSNSLKKSNARSHLMLLASFFLFMFSLEGSATQRNATVVVKNNTGSDIFSLKVLHKYSNEYTDPLEWDGILKSGDTTTAGLVRYNTGFLTTGRDWWQVSWVDMSGRVHYSDPNNFRPFVDGIETVWDVITLTGGVGLVAGAGVLAGGCTVASGGACAGVGATALVVGALIVEKSFNKLMSNDSTVGFKQHILRSEDAINANVITLNSDGTISFDSSSGSSETVYKAYTPKPSDEVIEKLQELLDPYAPSSVTITGDFDADGLTDTVNGHPSFDQGSGNIHISYGKGYSINLSQSSNYIEGTARVGDSFGQSLAVGKFNSDEFDDLAVGVPGDNIGSAQKAGAIHIFYGSESGLTSANNKKFSQNSEHIKGGSEPFDNFGFSLIASDFNDDGIDDLAIGVPGEDIQDIIDAGAINIIYGAHDGLTSLNNKLFSQDSQFIHGKSEPFDRFGFSLAAANFGYGKTSDLAIGVPGEDVRSIIDAGAVNIIYGSSAGLSSNNNQIFSQDSNNIKGAPEPFDSFGYSLASGNLNNDQYADLAIGVHQEDIRQVVDAGAVNIIYGSSSGLTSINNQIFSQSSKHIVGGAEPYDRFGYSLAIGDFNDDSIDDLAVGVPWEDIHYTDVGAINIIYGSSNQLTTLDNEMFYLQKINHEANDGDLFSLSLMADDINDNKIVELVAGVSESEDVILPPSTFPFERFASVDNKVSRSSAPYYRGDDSDQKIDLEAISTLRELKITAILSFNAEKLSLEERKLLRDANIQYKWSSVEDFTPQTINQLISGVRFVKENTSTLVYCGFGHGRTGTFITAWQIANSSDFSEPTQEQLSKNHVETDEQKERLKEFANKCKTSGCQ